MAQPMVDRTGHPVEHAETRRHHLLAVIRSGTRIDERTLADLGRNGSRIDLSTLEPLGSYRLALQGTPPGQAPDPQTGSTESALLTLSTLEGALLLSGNGTWGAKGLNFRGEATARDAGDEALTNLLNIIGRRDGARSVISIG